jgi:hypothetical protein
MRRVGLYFLFAVLLMTASACGDSTSTSTTPAPAPATMTEFLTGVLPAAVNNTPQTSFVTFTVVQDGVVTLTLTKADETLPTGAVVSPIVGLSLGTPDAAGTTCVVTTAPTQFQAGAPTVSGTLSAGKACILVSDLTVQLGPVNYTIVVAHS